MRHSNPSEVILSLLEERDGKGCKRCHKTGIGLMVYHINGNRKDVSPSNLELWCRTCVMLKVWERKRQKKQTGWRSREELYPWLFKPDEKIVANTTESKVETLKTEAKGV